MLPLVSVIVPAYNQAVFLTDALNSIRAQTYSNWETLIIDDGSQDETGLICKQFTSQDSRFSYFRQDNSGPSAARNAGIRRSQGQYLCLLDADDKMETRKIEQQIAYFLEFPQTDILYTALYIINNEGLRIGEIKSQSYAPEDFLALMFFRNMIPNPNTIMAKRACLVNHPYNTSFKHAEDYELMMRLAHLYRFDYLDLPLTSYRRHAENLSNDLNAHYQAGLKVSHSYSIAHIKEVVQRSSFLKEEKDLLEGKILFNREDFEEALLIFQSLPTALASFYSGNCSIKLDQRDAALKHYERSLQRDSTNPACYNNLGALYFLSGQKEKAKMAFKKAIELKNNYLDAIHNLQNIDSVFNPIFTWRELRKDLLPYTISRKDN